ncbi:MAG: hypothetical protein JWO76_3589 [Nocardioides sp.]|jgi:WXG100 family type VII secretion target|nr:hypothetical protein [Nocardioides sp.]
MDLAAEYAELERASSLVAEIESALTRETDRAQGEVESLVTAGWVGDAADAYARAWSEWREGAHRVLQALRAESVLLADHRADLGRTDETVVGGLGALHQRLGPS